MTDNEKNTQNFIETNLTNNLKHLMQVTGTKSIELAEIVGVSAESIGKLKNGTFHNPSLRVIAGISTHFKVSLDELIYGKLEDKSQTTNINNDLKPSSYVPIIDWDKIKTWKNETSASSIIVENINTKNVFALYMEYTYGVFLENSFIFVDVTMKPKSNDYVLVLNIEKDIFNIKKYIIEDEFYLQSVMLDVNTVIKHVPTENVIFGVVFGYQKTKFFRYN